MMTAATTVLLAVIAAGGVAALILVARGDDPDRDDATAAQLLSGIADEPDAPAADQLPAWSIADTVQVAPVGAHRAVGRHAHEEIGDNPDYQPRHSLEHIESSEIPPSLVPVLPLMTPAERARELVRQLGQSRWHPWLHLPRLERIRYVAGIVAERNGVPLLLGSFQRTAVLP